MSAGAGAQPQTRPAPLSAVVFDVGNTLLGFDYAWLAAHFGRSLATVRRVEWAVRHGGIDGYFAEVARRLGLPAELGAEVLVEHDRRPEGLWCIPDPEAAPLLTALQARGLRLGVVSNADGRVRAQLQAAGLARFFAVIVDSAEAGVRKPDPAIFRLAADALGVPCGEAMYVGDIYQIDVLGARAAGMRALWLCPSGVADPAAADRPERIARLADIMERV